ncbi:hypothetical protein BK659_17630 [Pseudomonas brassicacearum]|uniref:Uncharacterized protein n=1 Tax=Pseudomonas brassicacearum TaxID=930166 RepID=A0A423H4E5_9PSED|nr:hypothetical protein BK659_17630 [Pseudomonas brassicacearum]
MLWRLPLTKDLSVLLLKLSLIPGFLLLISLAGKRWGPSVAGWLSGLPVVVGPILFFLAVEQGPHSPPRYCGPQPPACTRSPRSA